MSSLVAWCREVAKADLDGVTISGGEPFEQPDGLRALARCARTPGGATRDLDFDILCYSGYPLARLQRHHAALLALLDAIIPEPFVDGKPLTHLWRGSANQPLVPLSHARARTLCSVRRRDADSGGKRMQVAVEGGRVWMIGIPARGDMARLETLCAQRGLELGQGVLADGTEIRRSARTSRCSKSS